jgi:hypothetical protein
MKLALGTVQFGIHYGVANTGGRVSFVDARGVVNRARQLGMATLDTAVAYGDSEVVLGKIGVQTWNVITKLPAVPKDCENVSLWVKTQVIDSCKRLKLNRVHGLLLHRPDQLHKKFGDELYAALRSLKSEGLVNKIGVSVYGPTELDTLIDQYAFDLVQAPLNILDRSMVESGWALRLKSLGVEVHTRSAFLQGLLLMPKQKRPAKFDRWDGIWSEWERWLAETNLTPLQACLRYANGLDCIDAVVIGVDSVTQLNEVFAASTGQLPRLPNFAELEDGRLVNPATWSQL